MKRLDFIIIVLAIGVALSVLAFNNYRMDEIEKNSNVLSANIIVGGVLYESIPLTDKEETILLETDFGVNKIVFHDNGVSIHEADCPDHVCIDTGFISKPGEIIACLPHRVIIEITGQMEGEIDGLSE